MDIDEIRRENIRRLEARHGAPALAERAGMSLSQFYNLRDGAKDSKTGKRRGMRKETAWKIEEAAGVERGYLDSLHPEIAESRTPKDDEFALVPQLDVEAACGSSRFVDHVVVKGGLAFKRSSLKDFGVTEQTARVIYASGGSMAPTIQDGCVVLLNTADTTAREGKVYAICTPEGGLVLKRLIRDYHPSLGAQAWIMRSDNPDKNTHPDKMLPPDDRTMIVGRAIWNDNKL
ncbi:S24 family peptidase [Ralstonia solanacearum species complex bacterium KE101]|uniref:S24 family peptidase n=1 Tax=Ralstonia solanacearum species complex bacterium KE101 TaxID=3119587 RepID=UPI0014331FA0|nr:HTH-type transcriptional regulator PrtR [Ralstonia solanacearum]NKA55683.1 HTH-type transcriptional regulator PrtR [Ralstonia solanacearum]NKA68199.1 HTH-type transcriptional regulator PrtR [Ralstonia solanacearum]NKA85900.1 HTH-type transcriptional regulator PrtR [Ralstonia solanacearum]NKF54274.1 HTH-type transcriptional regulator PrtR [Ralstonia solanacearum]